MAKMKSREFVAKAIDIAENYATLYVMGCFGAPIKKSNVDRYTKNHAYNQQPVRANMIRVAADNHPPVFGFDCVNLAKGILWGWNGDPNASYGGARYNTNGVPDTNADGMIAKCTGVSTSGWESMVPGEGLWMPGHWGIYIGDGLAVECTPAWKNCVQITAVGNIGSKAGYPTRRWTKHGRIPYVDYSDAGPVAKQPWKVTLDNLLSDGIINSPDYWENVLRGRKVASAENVKALMDKYHSALKNK